LFQPHLRSSRNQLGSFLYSNTKELPGVQQQFEHHHLKQQTQQENNNNNIGNNNNNTNNSSGLFVNIAKSCQSKLTTARCWLQLAFFLMQTIDL
jgi:hypothetical protein